MTMATKKTARPTRDELAGRLFGLAVSLLFPMPGQVLRVLARDVRDRLGLKRLPNGWAALLRAAVARAVGMYRWPENRHGPRRTVGRLGPRKSKQTGPGFIPRIMAQFVSDN
jgi:hypothetical protein